MPHNDDRVMSAHPISSDVLVTFDNLKALNTDLNEGNVAELLQYSNVPFLMIGDPELGGHEYDVKVVDKATGQQGVLRFADPSNLDEVVKTSAIGVGTHFNQEDADIISKHIEKGAFKLLIEGEEGYWEEFTLSPEQVLVDAV